MEMLGLKPTPNSGSGWIVKEDGQNENVICQLKSTDARSIRIEQRDFKVLEHNAGVCHKIPLFAIQFLNDNSTYILCKPEDLQEISEYINTGKVKTDNPILNGLDIPLESVNKITKTKKVESARSARENFYKERDSQYKKGKI